MILIGVFVHETVNDMYINQDKHTHTQKNTLRHTHTNTQRVVHYVQLKDQVGHE